MKKTKQMCRASIVRITSVITELEDKTLSSENTTPTTSVHDHCSTGFWAELDTQLMVMAAHRYCLGRQSYVVGAAINWLRKHRTNFERNTIRVIVRDTVEALQDGHAGSQLIDVPGWERLASELFSEMPEEDREWVRSSVAHRDRDWPLSVR